MMDWVGYLAGYFIGDGSAGPLEGRKNRKLLFLGNKDDWPRVESAFAALGIVVNKRYYHNERKNPRWVSEVWTVTLPVKYHWVLEGLAFGVPLKQRRLPIIRWDFGSFLSGLWDSDGTVGLYPRPGKAPYMNVVFTSAALSLVQDLSDLLNSVGVDSRFTAYRNGQGAIGKVRVTVGSLGPFRNLVSLQPKKQLILDRMANALQ